MNKDRILTFPSMYMRRAWNEWYVISSPPFIKFRHGIIRGEFTVLSWSACIEGRERRLSHCFYSLLLRQAFLQVGCMSGLLEKLQVCQIKMLKQVCYTSESDEERTSDMKCWIRKYFALFGWRTGWWCRRLEPSMEWENKGLRLCWNVKLTSAIYCGLYWELETWQIMFILKPRWQLKYI